jgi:predicted transcriptional regulator
MKNITWKAHKKELLKDKKLQEELEKLEPEFELARQIIELRISQNLTQAELASRAHTSQVVISRLENAEANPSLALIKKIFKALGKDVQVAAR